MRRRGRSGVGVTVMGLTFAAACGGSDHATPSGAGGSAGSDRGQGGRTTGGLNAGGVSSGGALSGGAAGHAGAAGAGAIAQAGAGGAAAEGGRAGAAGAGGLAGAGAETAGGSGAVNAGGATSGGAAGNAGEAGSAGAGTCKPRVRWARTFGDTNEQAASAIAMDATGNVVITGNFSGSIDFGGGALSAAAGDVFVARFDAQGNHLYSKSFGTSFADTGFGVATDRAGASIVTGYVSGSVDFGGGVLTQNNATPQAYLVKYDAAGAFVFGKRFSSQFQSEGQAVATDASNDVIAVGTSAPGVDFGGGPDTGGSAYVVKYSENGTYVWSKHFGGSQSVNPHAVTVDASGNVFVVGSVGGPVDFGGGTLAYGGGLADAFLLELDANGTTLYAHVFNGSGLESAYGVAVDAQSRAYVAGGFDTNIDLGAGPLTSAGSDDVFWASFGATGSLRSAARFGDGQYQFAQGIAVDSAGNSAIAGGALGSVNFGGGLLMSQGGEDVFLARFDSSGHELCSALYGDSKTQGAAGIAANDTAIALTGSADGDIDFGSGVLHTQGDGDVFVAVLEP